MKKKHSKITVNGQIGVMLQDSEQFNLSSDKPDWDEVGGKTYKIGELEFDSGQTIEVFVDPNKEYTDLSIIQELESDG